MTLKTCLKGFSLVDRRRSGQSDSLSNVDIAKPENLEKKPQASKRIKSNKNFPLKTYIHIDDDDDDSPNDHHAGTNTECDSKFNESSKRFPVKLSKSKRTYPERDPKNCQGVSKQSNGNNGSECISEKCKSKETPTDGALVEGSIVNEREKALKAQEKENMKLKEIYRTKVQHDLKNLEMTCHDMASLLRGLGILVDNGPYASSYQIRAAYKRALLKFHPDRASGSDMHQQVEAEEKFKLISRMRDKFL
ncbi:hypothetical protein L1887_33699 [Cichorium endivia]|nr:hypothetical protein L1887_33699 [Cichorium endivia]